MYHVILDSPSPYLVNIPTPNQPTKLITAGQNFVAYDETLPPEEQSYLLPALRQHLQECVPSQNSFKASEAKRTIASEAVKRLDEQAKIIIRKIHRKIDLEYMETPEAAEEWGFQVKQGTGNILLPKTQSERLALLDTYIANEESRPPEERFTTPDLAVVTGLRDDLKTNLTARRTSRSRRKDSHSACTEALEALYDTLHGLRRLITRPESSIEPVTTGLEKWGFEVIKAPEQREGYRRRPGRQRDHDHERRRDDDQRRSNHNHERRGDDHWRPRPRPTAALMLTARLRRWLRLGQGSGTMANEDEG
ncbi:MAG: hypothetical protein H6631_17100 [Anaerolineaceae bacterium]|nr:hypothetical protein [Anaerolineaceae bacterium]